MCHQDFVGFNSDEVLHAAHLQCDAPRHLFHDSQDFRTDVVSHENISVEFHSFFTITLCRFDDFPFQMKTTKIHSAVNT